MLNFEDIRLEPGQRCDNVLSLVFPKAIRDQQLQELTDRLGNSFDDLGPTKRLGDRPMQAVSSRQGEPPFLRLCEVARGLRLDDVFFELAGCLL